MPMLRNATIYITTAKVLLLSALAPALLVLILGLKDKDGLNAFVTAGKVYLITGGIMLVVGLLAYFILAAYYKWHYIVEFSMGEDGFVHKQTDKQFAKAQVIAAMNTAYGIAAGNAGAIGRGATVSARNSMSTSFADVTKVRAVKHRNVIYVDSGLFKNQVYVGKEDFDFVLKYIKDRCPKAK